MKIAFDAKRAFLNKSGLGNYSRTTISLLSSLYPEDDYLLYTTKKGITEEGFPPADAKIILPKGLYSKFPSFWRSYHITGLLKKDKVDIYHGLSHELPRKIHTTGVKTVVTIHDLIFIRYPDLYKAIDRKIYLNKWLYASKAADKIIAISEQTKRDIIEFLHADESKIEVVYQTCNPIFDTFLNREQKQKIRQKYKLPENFILYVGTIEPRKNLLEVLKSIRLSNTGLPLVIIGKEKKHYAEKVHNYIFKHKMNQVVFLKDVPTSDLPGIYQNASLLIYPSSFEGFGLPVLEAVKSGVPVIAAKGSCLEETGGPDSVYIDPFNTEEFAASIQKVLSDSSMRKEMTEKGLNFANNFQATKFAKELHSVYESLH